jgi:hypothetical protein
MYKLLKLLGVLAVVASSIGHSSASSISEDFVFSYTTNGSFTLSNLSYSSPTSGNLLTGLSPYTSSSGGFLSGSGKLSEIISVDSTQTYTSDYSISHFTGPTATFSVSVSPVPLPASFLLFAMALFGLGLVGYHTAGGNKPVFRSKSAASL